jgi:hypothetical protein
MIGRINDLKQIDLNIYGIYMKIDF